MIISDTASTYSSTWVSTSTAASPRYASAAAYRFRDRLAGDGSARFNISGDSDPLEASHENCIMLPQANSFQFLMFASGAAGLRLDALTAAAMARLDMLATDIRLDTDRLEMTINDFSFDMDAADSSANDIRARERRPHQRFGRGRCLSAVRPRACCSHS